MGNGCAYRSLRRNPLTATLRTCRGGEGPRLSVVRERPRPFDEYREGEITKYRTEDLWAGAAARTGRKTRTLAKRPFEILNNNIPEIAVT